MLVGTTMLLATATGVLAYGPDGTPDVTYGGGDGLVAFSTGVGSTDALMDSALQLDGKTVMVGLTVLSGATQYSAVVARLNADGSPDPAWGVGQPTRYRDGAIVLDFGPGSDFIYSTMIQPDNKVLVVGSTLNGLAQDLVLARLTPQGALDPTFGGGDGIVVESLGSSIVAWDLAVQEDGKILVAGGIDNAGVEDIFVARYGRNGTRDTSFASTGRFVATITAGDDVARSVTVMQNGRIVVAGTVNDATVTRSAVVMRLMPNGTYDTTFGNGDGYETITALPAGLTATSAYSVVGLPTGHIVVGGVIGDGATFELLAARFTPAGVIDTTFGEGDGIALTSLPFSATSAGVTLQSDGKLLASGSTSDGTNNHAIVVRYTKDGVLDTTFDGDGQLSSYLGGTSGFGQALMVAPDGRITVAGSINPATDGDLAVARFDARSTLAKGSSLGPRVLLGPLDMTIGKTATIRMSIVGSSRSKCSISGGKVKGKAPGVCKVKMTIIPQNIPANKPRTFTKVTVVVRILP